MLREVCSSLGLNAGTLAGELAAAVKAALTGGDHDKTDKLIRMTERKRLHLTDTYLAGEMSREEYRELRLRYDNDLSKLRERHHAADSAESMFAAGTLNETISLLLSGTDPDDEFYTGLANRIEMFSNGSVEVTLQHMSGEWRFHVSSTGKSKEQVSAT
jgi:hypothetical protein